MGGEALAMEMDRDGIKKAHWMVEADILEHFINTHKNSHKFIHINVLFAGLWNNKTYTKKS